MSTSLIYEDGEDGNIIGWDIYDNDPTGATFANVEDSDRGSKVIGGVQGVQGGVQGTVYRTKFQVVYRQSNSGRF